MPASVSAGDLLLVALKMPPSRIGIYSNFTPVRFSIAGIASWLRKALGLPKSNRNCGWVLTAVSLMSLPYCGATGVARPQYHDAHNTVDAGSREPNQPLQTKPGGSVSIMIRAEALPESRMIVPVDRRNTSMPRTDAVRGGERFFGEGVRGRSRL